MIELKCVKGLFLGSKISCEDEVINAICYSSRRKEFINKEGVFLIKWNLDLNIWIIIEGVVY